MNIGYAILAMAALVTSAVNYQSLILVQTFYFVLFGIEILVLFGTSLRAVLTGSKEARIISIGFAAFCILGLYDILGGVLGLLAWSEDTYQWGMLFFIMSLGFVLEQRFEDYAVQLEESNEKLRDYSQTLEQKVEERTKALREAQAQLVMREKMASLGHLVAGVAHEVNTPIAAVHSAADVTKRCIDKIKTLFKSSQSLQELKSGEQFKKSFEILEDNNNVTVIASERMANIVQSLKTFARLDEAEYQKADIHEGLDSTLILINHEIKGRISVVKDYGEIPEINCYPNQLNQVFMNLLMNAVQAIENKGEITIRTYSQDGSLIVEIADNGCGIPSENISKIFDPGFTTRGVGVGTGLGLSITYNIIEKHHGDITVDSKVGEGTSFTVRLPINGA